MHPTDFDLEVWSDYQIGELRRARRQADLPQPPPRLRIALARTLITLANRVWQPEPAAPASQPRYQPS